MAKAATQLNNQELRVRNAALNARRLEREDETWKSYGILKYARRITEKDARIFLSQLMAGEEDGVISFEKEKTYDGIENGQWLTPGDTKYMVIHRIATHYEYKRRGTAGAFLEFARETARRRGVLSIRIDTHPDNQIMQSWLCKNGFIYCGWIWLINGSLRYAYENVL